MSAFIKPKQTSRWGSLLQGAVANLESRLDTILAEDGASKKVAAESARPVTPEPSRSPRRSRDSDSRQEYTSPRLSFDVRPSLDVLSILSPELAEIKPPSNQDLTALESIPQIHVDGERDPTGAGEVDSRTDATEKAPLSGAVTPQPPAESQSPRISYDYQNDETVQPETTDGDAQPPLSMAEYQGQLAQMKTDYQAAEVQRQEEVHMYVERIDALQAKLHYLANEAAESARTTVSESSGDSWQWKLAAKDEQIALLMEEGRKLSKTELDQSTLIKKLRARSAEDSRTLADTKRRFAAGEKSVIDYAERLLRLEASHKEAVTKASRLVRFEREAEELRKARDACNITIDTLRRQADTVNVRAEAEQKKAVAMAVEAERKVIQSIRDDIANSKIEKQLGEDKHRARLKTANDELQREHERSASLEQVLRNEILALESRLEVFRVRTEEVSSGIMSDGQAKLMRQVDILQAQYSQANENWQGIESSLQARLNTLESEKDEASRQEFEARRKARETGSNARRLQDQLDDVSRKCSIMEHELSERQAQAEKLQSRVVEFEQNLHDAKEEFDRERQTWDANMNTRIDEERTRWRQEMNQEPQSAVSRIDSPTFLFTRKPYGLDIPSLPAKRGLSRQTSVDFPFPMPPLERQMSLTLHNRRTSAKPGRSPDPQTPNGLESGRSTPYAIPNIPYNIPETPSTHAMDQDDPFDNESSPRQTVNDMISVSTAAAGPSVQLVERMSATVRRLENEKAASKDELARLVAQRDGARKEVVTLMREIDAKRAVDAKVAKVEQDLTQLGQRYQTTLEMLGEKSERVEELEADVADLKKIYRELIESTMK